MSAGGLTFGAPIFPGVLGPVWISCMQPVGPVLPLAQDAIPMVVRDVIVVMSVDLCGMAVGLHFPREECEERRQVEDRWSLEVHGICTAVEFEPGERKVGGAADGCEDGEAKGDDERQQQDRGRVAQRQRCRLSSE